MEAPLFSHPTVDRPADPPRPDEPTSSSPHLTSICRLSTIFLISALSLWANHEASKGFQITVLQAPTATPAARRYNLMFVSNGAAVRQILSASVSIEQTLFPSAAHFPRKPIRSITLRVASHNLTRPVLVTGAAGDYVIHLSLNVIDAEEAVVGAVCYGVGRVWVWDGRGRAPEGVVEGLVGYMCGDGRVGVEGCEMGAEGLVGYCEEKREGFVGRLNREMEEGWEDEMWDRALGSSVRVLCDGFGERVGNSTGEIVELRKSSFV